MVRAKYWKEIAKDVGFVEVETLKACITDAQLKTLHIRKGQRKLTPKQVQGIYDIVGKPG